MADIKLLCGTKDEFDAKAKNVLGTIYLTTVDNARSYLYYGNGTNFLNIVPELLTVANGGTGRNTLDAGYALIGNGTQPVALRAITNSETLTHITPSTNLITANTLKNWNGAYDIAGSSNIQHLGTISKGTWAASVIAVPYGGTGKNTFIANGVLYGNDTGAINVTTAGGQGTILSPNAANVPSFAEPSWSWTDGTAKGPTLTLTLQKKGWTTPAIPKATATTSGIVTTDSQTFAGAKTFSGATKIINSDTSNSKATGALIVTGGVGIGGSLYANAISSTNSLSAGTSLTVGGTGTIGGDLTVNGGEIYLGTTNEHCTMSYDTTTDTLTISFPS